MRYDWLLEPISEAEPCGPDLDDAGDDQYLNYVLAVTGRIPERYYDKTDGRPVDRTAIKLKDEVETIDALLRQTRDIRLLCIEARFQSFSGELSGFADCIDAIAGLLERFWPDVHPKAFEGDFTLRQNNISGLDDWWQIIQPLHHAPLVRDRRLGPVMFRYVAIANGETEAREDENVPDLSEVQRAIAAEENRALSDLNFEAVSRASAALARISNAFIENSGYDYTPNIELFRSARPELGGAAPGATDDAEATAEDGGGAAGVAVALPKAAAVTGLITSQGDAAAALLAIEAYFAACEPSAPALLLVHQARTLVGKPLVHALEILLPDDAPRVMIKIQGDLNLQLNMEQLKQLAENVLQTADGAAGADGANGSFSAGSRAEAMTLMAEVEHFFRNAEPSSPVPMLIAKASGFMNRDFGTILKDLVPPLPPA
jgi:type VI secretion system protein ImpA